MKHLFFWAVFYQLVYGVCVYGQRHFGAAPWLTPAGVGIFLLLLTAWIRSTGRTKSLGLGMGRFPKGWDLPLVGLVFLPALINLLVPGTASVSFSTLCLLVFAAIIEELFFRGFALQKKSLGAVLASAALFAALHSLNLFQSALPDVLAQVLFAFFAGLCYALLALRLGSLLPCALAHILTNLTGASLTPQEARPLYVFVSAILAIGAIPYLIHFKRQAIR